MSRRRRSSDDDREAVPLEVIDLGPQEEPPARGDPEREHLERRRGPVVIAAVVILALVAVTIVSRTHSSAHGRASSTTAVDGGQRSIANALFKFRVGAEVLTAGARGLLIIDTDTGHVTAVKVAGLPDDPVTIVAHSGRTIAVRVDSHLYWFQMPNAVAHRVEADTAFPAVTPGSLWLAAPGVATEVPGDPDRLPRARVVTTGLAIGATRAGLLVPTKAGITVQPTTGNGDARLLLSAPATVLGVHADRVAWMSNDCSVLSCPVRVTEVASGATASWLELVGHPSPSAINGSSAVFSPDGASVAITVADDNGTEPKTLVIADLRTRATNVVDAREEFGQPETPGSRASGTTVDWTLDGSFLLLAAPGTGDDRIAVLKPTSSIITPSAFVPVIGTTAAAIGSSSAGALDLARHRETGPIDSRAPTALGIAGLHLVGADASEIDVLDLGDNRIRTFQQSGTFPKGAGPSSIARVTGAWLVVRDDGVYSFPDARVPAHAIASGSQVFASPDGRHAWLFDPTISLVHAYDPATGTIASPVTLSGQMVAVDNDLVILDSRAPHHIDLLDGSGRLRHGPTLNEHGPVELMGGSGTTILFTDHDGLHAYDLTTQQARLVTSAPVDDAALSPDGTHVAWIQTDVSGGHVLARSLSNGPTSVIGGDADRVLVADDGLVLYTESTDVFTGRVGRDGSFLAAGLAPEPTAALALG